jgi:hypothetical protein
MGPRFGFGQFGAGELPSGRALLVDGPARLLGQVTSGYSLYVSDSRCDARFESDLAVDVEAVERLRPGRQQSINR